MTDNFMSEDLVKTKVSYAMLFRRMWPYARKEKVLLFAAILTVFIGSAIARFIPSLIGYAIDHGVIQKQFSVFSQIAVVYFALEIMRSCCSFANVYLFQRFGNRMLFHLREDLLRHALNLPLQFFNKTPTGRIVTRLTNDVASLGELFADGVISIFTQFVAILSVIVALSIISLKLTLIVLVSAPFFVLASILLSNKIRVILSEQKKKLSAINSFLAENLNGMKVVQLYHRVSKNRQRFVQLSSDYKVTNIRSVRTSALMQPIMNLFTAATISSTLYFGGLMRLEGTIGVGALVAFLMNVQDFIHPLREILDKYQQFQNSLASAERIFTLMDETAESEPSNVLFSQKFRGDLQIKNLNFRYEAHLPLVLEDLNLNIQAGESIALIGRTGSGKSTFISLLQRFYEAPSKSIFIDGIAIEAFTRFDVRRRVGVVQQDNFIFRGTIRENINLGDLSITDEQVSSACEKIGYLGFLHRTGRTLDSEVQERGANLSVGERQLIAFARILAFDPDILILDEATANIDSESESIIQKATFEITRNRTSILIAHRLSTIEQCDRIIVLDHGKIVEMGTHAQLMKLQGVYFGYVSAGLKDEARHGEDSL